MSYNENIFQFCPYCYEDFPPDEECGETCNFCGGSLLEYLEDIGLVDERADVSPQYFAPPKAAAPKRKVVNKAKDIEYKYYSVILKACQNKESLGNRLEKIFHRDITAIRLAMDKLPSVIVYKGNVADMASVIRAFHMENAAISVLGDDFELDASICEKYPILYKQPADIQDIFYASPVRLWLGDRIYTAVHANMQDQTGMLVITDQGIYFLDKGFLGDCRWFIIPYYRVLEISFFEDEMGTGLFVKWENRYEHQPATIHTEKFYITDERLVGTTVDLALLSHELGNYRQRKIRRCQGCVYKHIEILSDHDISKKCPRCNGEISFSLLISKKM